MLLNNKLRELANRVRAGDESASPLFRQEFEPSATTLIRCAIRTGMGEPRLVRWVQHNLPAAAGSPEPGRPAPVWAAPTMARMLCNQLLQEFQGRPPAQAARETVRMAG